MSKHSIFSPSAAYRWIHCPASMNAPRPPADKYTLIGTAVHKVLEHMVYTVHKESGTDTLIIGDAIKSWRELPPPATDDTEAIDIYYAKAEQTERWFVDSVLASAYWDSIEAEVKVDFSKTIGLQNLKYGEAYGTLDLTYRHIDRPDTIMICDLKTSSTLRARNFLPQLKLYALGYLEGTTDLDRLVELQAVKVSTDKYTIHSYSFSYRELLEWAKKECGPTVDLVNKDWHHSKYVPDNKYCWYCGSNADCRAAFATNVEGFFTAE